MRFGFIAVCSLGVLAAFAAATEGLQITSSAFPPNQSIPARYTCEGANVSPPLAFANVPAGAKSLVLVVEDPDAPDPKAPKLVWDHWLLYNLPPAAASLPEAVTSEQLPKGTLQGKSSWKKTGYGGPCPPIGRHRYFHRLYALDVLLPDLSEPGKDALLLAMKGHILAQAELIGTYEKGKR